MFFLPGCSSRAWASVSVSLPMWSASRTPKLERIFEHTVERKHAEQFAADAPVYLINYEITLPAARRELAGAEWMPRGARYSN